VCARDVGKIHSAAEINKDIIQVLTNIYVGASENAAETP
jgi:hypothetical protein